MKIVHDRAKLSGQLATARAEAKAGLRQPRRVPGAVRGAPRHIEVQVLGTATPPSRWVSANARSSAAIRSSSKRLRPWRSTDATRSSCSGCAPRRGVDWLPHGGTLEFLLDENRRFYFMEMNTRIQVEHTGPGRCSGWIWFASRSTWPGRPLKLRPDLRPLVTHRLRITAEDPVTFAPSPGRITR